VIYFCQSFVKFGSSFVKECTVLKFGWKLRMKSPSDENSGWKIRWMITPDENSGWKVHRMKTPGIVNCSTIFYVQLQSYGIIMLINTIKSLQNVSGAGDIWSSARSFYLAMERRAITNRSAAETTRESRLERSLVITSYYNYSLEMNQRAFILASETNFWQMPKWLYTHEESSITLLGYFIGTN